MRCSVLRNCTRVFARFLFVILLCWKWQIGSEEKPKNIDVVPKKNWEILMLISEIIKNILNLLLSWKFLFSVGEMYKKRYQEKILILFLLIDNGITPALHPLFLRYLKRFLYFGSNPEILNSLRLRKQGWIFYAYRELYEEASIPQN